MGRLTLRNVFGRARCKKNGTKFCYETDECLYCKHNDEILERLANYEDMEEQGRLITLPCAVRSRIYFILENGEIDSQLIDNVQTALFFKDINDNLIRGFYLTKEEAEAKLKELEGGVNHERNE